MDVSILGPSVQCNGVVSQIYCFCPVPEIHALTSVCCVECTWRALFPNFKTLTLPLHIKVSLYSLPIISSSFSRSAFHGCLRSLPFVPFALGCVRMDDLRMHQQHCKRAMLEVMGPTRRDSGHVHPLGQGGNHHAMHPHVWCTTASFFGERSPCGLSAGLSKE